ncbi:4'-phosphopantetheinyl transferase superfamily [Paraphysoderma sedebokerense]|nr:4'-phosphopantetheinyl transferase superfamily [Paraphysoderma sedebokerense]KAI9138025.1 4'-phosphopantetheinyl transferase superfamily [Paraphysoderma sedebokerense]
MPILGIGIDILRTTRLLTLINNSPLKSPPNLRLSRFAKRVLSVSEFEEFKALSEKYGVLSTDHIESMIKYLGVRWTIKEATYKALYPQYRLTWKDVSVVKVDRKPALKFHVPGLHNIVQKSFVSVSHDGEYVVASVVLESQ